MSRFVDDRLHLQGRFPGGAACATIASTSDGAAETSGQNCGCHSRERTIHFGQCMKACSTVMTSTVSGAFAVEGGVRRYNLSS